MAYDSPEIIEIRRLTKELCEINKKVDEYISTNTGGGSGGGTPGTNGWTPIFGIVEDGERRVQWVTGWFGGTGAKPNTGQFVGANGFVSTIEEAVDLRGPKGEAGTTNTLLAPSTLTGTAGNAVASLSWTAVNNAEKYQLIRASNIGFTNGVTVVYEGAALSYNDTQRLNGTTYYYKVVSIALNYTSSTSNTAVVTPQGVVSQLATPLLQSVAGNTQTNHSWLAVNNANKYVLRRSLQSNRSDAIVVYQGPNLSFTDTGRVNGTPLYYDLVAEDTTGQRTASAPSFTQVTPTAGAVYVEPVVNAGTDQTVQLPTSTLNVSATATGGTGTIVSYLWSKVSGPSGGAISTPTASSTSITGLTAGNYIYKIVVTDSNGHTAEDSLGIVVNAAAAYTPPSVNAGGDQSLAANTTSATLLGVETAGSNPITTRAWSQVSGPNTATITNGNTLNAMANNLIAGTYVFRLTVGDGTTTAQDTLSVVIAQPSVSTIRVYYGTKDTDGVLTLDQITASTRYVDIVPGAFPTMDFTYNQYAEKWYWVAVPAAEAAFTIYDDTQDEAAIGAGGTFRSPVDVSGTYDYYQSDYTTVIPYNVTFKR